MKEFKRELELNLTPKILDNLNNNIWPLHDPVINKGVKTYINISTYLLAVLSSMKFINTFSINYNEDSKILADNYEPLNTKRPLPLINRDSLKDLNNWTKILEEAANSMDSILTKIWAVENIANSEGAITPGFDNKRFLTIPRKVKSNTDAIEYLKDLINKLKYDISISEGATDQTIHRKGKNNLNEREKFRRNLKTRKGKLYIKKCKEELKTILDQPKIFVESLIKKAAKNNLTLRFSLLNSLKTLKIKKFNSDPILRVWVPKLNGNLRPIAIPTLKDRTIQMLLKIVMEPYLEPLGDRNSFG
jgi:hypothetical protein